MTPRKTSRKLKILLISAGGVIIAAMVLAVVIPLLAGFGSSNIINSEGVFIKTSSKKWVRVKLNDKPWIPTDNKTYIVYFKNIASKECYNFDTIYSDFVKDYMSKDNFTPVQIICTWYPQQCGDPTAIASFEAYRVPYTPFLVIISDLKIIYYGPPPMNLTKLQELFEYAMARLHNVTSG